MCNVLRNNNIEIIATSSTGQKIKKLGFDCQLISKHTKFNEILEGRVKTLHPKIFASILYKRDRKSQTQEFNKLNFPTINYVIVNLYPFSKNKMNPTEMIDVGGVSLLRADAKNFFSKIITLFM